MSADRTPLASASTGSATASSSRAASTSSSASVAAPDGQRPRRTGGAGAAEHTTCPDHALQPHTARSHVPGEHRRDRGRGEINAARPWLLPPSLSSCAGSTRYESPASTLTDMRCAHVHNRGVGWWQALKATVCVAALAWQYAELRRERPSGAPPPAGGFGAFFRKVRKRLPFFRVSACTLV